MEVPHLHAHTVFIELTFGLNTIFSLFKKFDDFVANRIEEKIDEFSAHAGTIETASPGGSDSRRGNVESQLRKIKEDHLWFHHALYWPMISLAILCALAALLILYGDWVEEVGWWCGVLALPVFLDLSASGLNFLFFCRSGNAKLGRLAALHAEFDQPPPPPQQPLPPPQPPANGS